MQGFPKEKARAIHPGPLAFVIMGLFTREGEAEAGGENQVVGFGSGRRIGHVDVAGGCLPAQEGLDLGAEGAGEGGAILARVAQIREDVRLLGEDAVGAELFCELLAEVKCGEAVDDGWRTDGGSHARRNFAVTLMRPDQAAEDVEGALGLHDGMPSEAASEHGAKIELLKLIFEEVAGAEGEELRIDVVVIACAGADVVGGSRFGQAIVGEDLVVVESGLVVRGGTYQGFAGSQRGGVAVAAGEREAEISRGGPVVQPAGMQRILKGLLGGGGADGWRSRHRLGRAGGGSHSDLFASVFDADDLNLADVDLLALRLHL